MLPFFKGNIDFLTEHAVDPDKRRYAFRLEAPRHFLDMDRYKDACLPENFVEAFSAFAMLKVITHTNDTLLIHSSDTSWCNNLPNAVLTDGSNVWNIGKKELRHHFRQFVLPAYYDLRYQINPDSIRPLLPTHIQAIKNISLIDSFTIHGIVPYIIEQQYDKLVRAFKKLDKNEIINIAADLGHYIADAHVPLHACSNYNGQKTDQYGIHAFWESRIPELFADTQYDFLVGKATYIRDVRKFAWETIRTSGSLADSVLSMEAALKSFYPRDQQMCFDQRLGQTVWIQCRDYAAAFQDKMQGMVEIRMREAIHSVGSLWYSAWVEAGSPPLNFSNDIKAAWKIDSTVLEYDNIIKKGGDGYGRNHE
ncbi:MAG TPA: hypothetical protein PLR24_01815 [Saprospiraceae bacterium]|nr:hypothetical protein [Saprospiraceae bacterium]